MAEVEVKSCSNPGCDRPGTSSCSACKTTVYCCVICQTADWTHHKEECQGHLRKVGMTNLTKAKGFHQQENYVQALRYGELAATKLKQLKDRRLETVVLIDAALTCQFDSLNTLGRYREGMECAKECYTLWAMNHMRNPGSMNAALLLIQSCLGTKEYEDAEHYARHAYFMIAEMTDNFIPVDQQQWFLARGSYWLSISILCLARVGGIPPEEKRKAGEEAIELARKALELFIPMHGSESGITAFNMGTLADVLDHFNNVDDDEVLRLRQQAITIYRRLEGSLSMNVAVQEGNLGDAYDSRAKRAEAVNDLERCVTNLELALPRYREAARVYRAINQVNLANDSLRKITETEEQIRLIGIARAAAAAAATRG